MNFRPTPAQAVAHGAYLGGMGGFIISVLAVVIHAVGFAERSSVPMWLAAVVPLGSGLIAGAVVELAVGRNVGAEIDDLGIRPVLGRHDRSGAAWPDIRDVRTERHGGRTRVAVSLDAGQIVWLPAPYHGRWLARDPSFERKLFMVRHLWETHRSFAITNHRYPVDDVGGAGW